MMEADPVCSCSFRCSINSVLQQNHHRFIHKIPRSDSLLYKDFSFSTSLFFFFFFYTNSVQLQLQCFLYLPFFVPQLCADAHTQWPHLLGFSLTYLVSLENVCIVTGMVKNSSCVEDWEMPILALCILMTPPLPRGVRQGFGRLIQKEARTPTASKFTCKLYNSYSSGQGRVHSGFKGLCGRVSAEHLQATRWEQRVERRACKCRQSERGRSTNELPGVSLTDVCSNNTPI